MIENYWSESSYRQVASKIVSSLDSLKDYEWIWGFILIFFEIKHFKVNRIHKVEYYLALKSKEILTCYNIDEPWRRAEWNKLVREGKILYDSPYVRYPERKS